MFICSVDRAGFSARNYLLVKSNNDPFFAVTHCCCSGSAAAAAFPKSMSCSMSIEQKLCKVKNISTPICVECDKMYRFKVCVQEFWYCLPGLIFNLSYPRSTILHAKKLLQVAKHFKKYEESYTVFFGRLTRTDGLVVKAGCRKLDDMSSIPDEC